MCPASETEKEVNSVGVWHITGEHGVHSLEGFDEFGPKLSRALPFMVCRSHDPSVDVLPRSSEKIRKQSLSPKQKAHHELPWSGKEVAKDCKNLVSDTLNVPAPLATTANTSGAGLLADSVGRVPSPSNGSSFQVKLLAGSVGRVPSPSNGPSFRVKLLADSVGRVPSPSNGSSFQVKLPAVEQAP